MSRPIRAIRFGHTPNCSSLGNILNVLLWTQAAVAAVWVAAEGWEARRRRPEPDGGETRRTEDPPALVRTGEGRGPLEAHLAVTEPCSLPCAHCHVEPSVSGEHVPLATIEARLRALVEAGVLRVAIGGGEVLRHPELGAIPGLARAMGLGVGVTTSGLGGDPASLEGFDQVNLSLDALGEGYRGTRGVAGDGRVLAVINALHARGVRVGINLVLDRSTFTTVEETVRVAVAAGASEVQLLRLKPVGRAVGAYAELRLTPAQGLEVWPLAQRLMAEHPAVNVRIDCALVPFLVAHRPDLARLEQFAFWGCHGGDELTSVDGAGNTRPCSFVPEAPDARWREGVIAAPCATCAYQRVCRGGCHAVARRLTGELFAPDPECPQVLGHPA